jgi:hypothetical protein
MLGLYVIYNDKALQHHKSMKMEDKIKKKSCVVKIIFWEIRKGTFGITSVRKRPSIKARDRKLNSKSSKRM